MEDFTGDDQLDMVLLHGSDDTISVLVGNGDGTFQTPIEASMGTSYASTIAHADMNNDDHLDLIVTSSNMIRILIGNGDGRFQQGIDYPMIATTATIASLNNDAFPDIVVTNRDGNKLRLLLSQSDGTLRAAPHYVLSQGLRSLAAGDLNGDTHIDLASVHPHDNRLSIFTGDGSGHLPTTISYTTPSGPTGVAVGDVNGDQRPDAITVQNADHSVSVFMANTAGMLELDATYMLNPHPSGPWTLTLGDVNNDSYLDVITNITWSSEINVLFGNGDGTFQPYVIYETAFNPCAMAIHDMNQDAIPDIIVGHEGNHISVLLGTSAGTFETVIQSVEHRTCALAVADWNGDMVLDLATGDLDTDTISIRLGNGDGTFQPGVDLSTDQAPESLTTTDFNQDTVP
ncbi:MAG: VCBS repeat-containing protein, partial [Blastochloris sp.]|nr:VCBS repeat-containing protein [Blastochloris sp.]